ncbi:cystatin C (amyloid angiopathy and cerebral hemorrhage) [Enoplosus armatus]|uniref:cystatin C (amyloid angiopathy and cerebral hemorrhage) n=1 Tax=Enoplosus armatus TaxID=215367 RepID=UPI003991921E
MMLKIVFTVLAAVVAVGLGGMVGGYNDIDMNDEGARNALDFAVVRHNSGNNDIYLSQVAEVVKVQRQVVAGAKYSITVRMAKTPCRKDRAIELCATHQQDPEKAQPYTCTFTVWSRPWLNDIRLLDEKC